MSTIFSTLDRPMFNQGKLKLNKTKSWISGGYTTKTTAYYDAPPPYGEQVQMIQCSSSA